MMIQPSSRLRQQGLSLIELMIAMVLGLVVIGVVFANYLGATSGRNHSQALGQMAEDASVALNYVRKHIAQAGYSRVVGVDASTGKLVRSYSDIALVGCSGDFSDPGAATMAELTCPPNQAAASHSIAVAYEADNTNSALRGASNLPGNCVGQPIDATPIAGSPGAGTFHLSQARLFVDGNASLACRAAGTPAAPLVNNIVSMRLRYGVGVDAPPADGDFLPPPPVQFMPAENVATANAWRRVSSVRVCVVVRSEEEVLPEPTPYFGCNALDADVNPITPADRRMYRAFSTTVMVQNRL